jgi:ATP-dependent helicase YprA (DUF1998 family)
MRLLLFDRAAGGGGVAEQAAARMAELAGAALRLLQRCECGCTTEGCFSCLQQAACGMHNRGLDARGARVVLQAALQELGGETEEEPLAAAVRVDEPVVT